jgi:hypothetical protein
MAGGTRGAAQREHYLQPHFIISSDHHRKSNAPMQLEGLHKWYSEDPAARPNGTTAETSRRSIMPRSTSPSTGLHPSSQSAVSFLKGRGVQLYDT